MKLQINLCIMGAIVLANAAAYSADVTLVDEGKARAALVLPSTPDPDEMLAATEIANHIRKMSGADLEIIKGKKAGLGIVSIEIGLSLNPNAKKAILAKGDDPHSLILEVTAKKIVIAGLTPRGTLFAAYELLEQLGCRWFMPCDIGTVIPEKKTVVIATGKTIQVPSFTGRHHQITSEGRAEWFPRCRLGGPNYGGHGMHIKIDPKKHPECFCKRLDTGNRSGHLLVSNPEVMKRLMAWAKAYMEKYPDTKYLTLGPSDGGGFGKSPWDADDFDPAHGMVSVTDRYVKCFNIILEELQKTYPDVGIAFYAYGQCMRPPVREKPNPRILPVIAPIDICRIHDLDNPLCKERKVIKDVITGWEKLGSRMYYRGYFFNLADQGLPYSQIGQVATELPYFYKMGIFGCRVETMQMWAHHAPGLYLATKLYWDATADSNAIMDDFFSKFYGPAEKPIHAYFNLLEKSYYEADYHTGNIFDIPKILTPTVMKELTSLIKQGQAAVGQDTIYAKRIDYLAFAHEYGQDNLDMVAALHAFRFKDALAAYNRADAKQKASVKMTPQPFSKYALRYLKRFWGDTVASAAERVSNGNEIVVKLPDEWLFSKDPKGGGEKAGFTSPAHSTIDWKPLKTYSQSWSNQGMRYLKGIVWYRTSVKVPAEYKGREINLWFGGIDDKAEVWINGKKLECLKKGAAPTGVHWEFAATPALKMGVDNVIVVMVSNLAINELGTGGITEPAMLWAKKK